MRLATLLKQGISPMFAQVDVAAALLGMDVPTFKRLVENGSLPGPCEVSGVQLYDMEDIRATLRGATPQHQSDFDI